MARREIEQDGPGPQGAGTRPQGPSGDLPTQAAARYLDAWDANQTEVTRLGPQVIPGGFGGLRG